MRITCRSAEDFLANLKGNQVYNDQIFVEKSSEPLNGTKETAVSFQLNLGFSAVLGYADAGESLLVCEIDCGIDRPGGTDGSTQQEAQLQLVQQFAEENGLKLLPGVLDV